MPLLDQVPRSFGDYEAAGGGRGLQTALAAWPVSVIQTVAASGLRGRGGAGFPTGEKWRSVRSVGAGPRFAVCNAAEGEPATFKDRLLLRTNPYQVLEGLAIAAYAVGAERAYIGLKQAFAPEVEALARALQEMREADALGGMPVEVVLGPDLYLFGEETGLEEVIEGRPPLPRVARPYVQGLFARPPEDNPTLVNNLETLANVPHILADGPDWLRANGTGDAPGTMLFTICGDVRREGVFELPLGSPLRYLVEDLAGGPQAGRAVKAIFPGASNAVVLPAQLDVPMDFDSMRRAGSGGPRTHPGAGERLDRRAEMRPADRREPAHAEPRAGLRRRVRQAPRGLVPTAAPAPLPQARRLGRDGGTVQLRPGLRGQATRLDLVAKSTRPRKLFLQ